MEEDAPAKRIKDLEREVMELRGEAARLRTALGGAVEEMLARRGFAIYRKERDRDVLRPDDNFREEFYSLMGRYSFRLFLRDAIKHRESFRPEGLSKFIGDEAAGGFGAFLVRAGLARETGDGNISLLRGQVKNFGPTLEWFLAEVMRRELFASAVWGVSFRNRGGGTPGNRPVRDRSDGSARSRSTGTGGGDYDLLAALEGRLLYAEVKSSPPRQIYETEIAAFIDRVFGLCPHLSLFVVDTELRMKDKIVFMFEQVLPKTPLSGTPVVRWKDELFRAGNGIFIVNSKGGLIRNIKEVISAFLKETAWQAV